MSALALRMQLAREARGLSLTDAEKGTRIRARYLNAIETGDYDHLPDGLAGRGFVKNYARFLNLDPDEALSQFEAEFGVPEIQLKEDVPPPPQRMQQQSEYTRVAPADLRWKGEMPDHDEADLDALVVSEDIDNATGTGITVPEISGLDGVTGRAIVIRPDHKLHASGSSFRLKGARPVANRPDSVDLQRRASSSSSRPSINASINRGYRPANPLLPYLGYALMAALAAGLVWFVLLPLARNGVGALDGLFASSGGTAVPKPGVATPGVFVPQVTILAPAVAPIAVGTQVPGTPDLGIAAPEGAASDAVRESTITVPPAAGGGLQLALDARERAPVTILVDGSVVWRGVPQLGPNPVWNAAKSITIVSGNAGAFDVIVNGERKGPPGARNEKVRVTYSL